MAKTRQKFVKLIGYIYACYSLTNFECDAMQPPERENVVDTLKLVWKNLAKSRWVNLFLAGFSHLEPLFVVAAKQNNKKILLQSQMDGKREREWKKSLELLSFWHEKATEYEVEQEAVFFERCDCLPSCSPSYTPTQKYSRPRWPLQKFSPLFKAEPVYEGTLQIFTVFNCVQFPL